MTPKQEKQEDKMENKKSQNQKSLVAPIKTRLSRDKKWLLFDMGSYTVIVSRAYIEAIFANKNNEEEKAGA